MVVRRCALRLWLLALARWLRARSPGEGGAPKPAGRGGLSARMRFCLGLSLLLLGSTGLEWARLSRLEFYLPGHGGGLLGFWLGPLGLQWLGATGSALLDIALLLLGLALVFGFSWALLAERLGAWIYAQVEARREQREVAQDLAMGQQAMRERDELVSELAGADSPAQPVILPLTIEPVLVEPPRSERVAKERQKPLFAELPDSRLPQVDLLDGALSRQETVAPETLEMTSRMIEKNSKILVWMCG